MLKFLYRTASVQFRIAGISPVQWDNRRMINMDLTNIVSSTPLCNIVSYWWRYYSLRVLEDVGILNLVNSIQLQSYNT